MLRDIQLVFPEKGQAHRNAVSILLPVREGQTLHLPVQPNPLRVNAPVAAVHIHEQIHLTLGSADKNPCRSGSLEGIAIRIEPGHRIHRQLPVVLGEQTERLGLTHLPALFVDRLHL